MNILVLGTGTGVLPMFLRQHFSTHLNKITTVEIDAGVLLVGRDHFGFNAEHDPQIDSINADAYEFVQSLDANQFDMILIDINDEAGGEGYNPPFKFFSPETNHQLKATSFQSYRMAVNLIQAPVETP